MDIEQKKAQLLAAMQAQNAGDSMPDNSLTTLDRSAGNSLPLSFAQQRLWFLHQLAPESAFYHMPLVIRLRGALDRGALQAALDALVERQASLRTCFVAHEGEPVQVVEVLVVAARLRQRRHRDAGRRGLALGRVGAERQRGADLVPVAVELAEHGHVGGQKVHVLG